MKIDENQDVMVSEVVSRISGYFFLLYFLAVFFLLCFFILSFKYSFFSFWFGFFF